MTEIKRFSRIIKNISDGLYVAAFGHYHVNKASNEISEFLGCPKLQFKIRKSNHQSYEDGSILMRGSQGKEYIFYDPEAISHATFHPEGDDNIITVSVSNKSYDPGEIARHEVFHAYHYRNNPSLRTSFSVTRTLLELIKFNKDKMDRIVSNEEKIYLNGALDIESFNSIAYETLARVYEKTRGEYSPKLKISLDFSLEGFPECIDKIGQLDFDLDFKGSRIFYRDLFYLLQQSSFKAYWLSEDANGLFLADTKKEPKISFSVKPIENEAEGQIYKEGRKMVVEAKYEAIPIEEAKKKVQDSLFRDYWYFSKEMIKRYKVHLGKIKERASRS